MSDSNISYCPVVTVRYFAVYPNGRRCSVTPEQVVAYRAIWESDDQVVIETDVIRQLAPVFGKVNDLPV